MASQLVNEKRTNKSNYSEGVRVIVGVAVIQVIGVVQLN
jgi:hypothetical protein